MLIAKIMIPCAKKCSLGYASMATNTNWFKIQNKNLFSYPRMLADLQPPRKVNIDTGLDHHPPSNLGPEYS
jgi:hypothetical protein